MQVFFGGVFGQTRKLRSQRGAKLSKQFGNRDFVVAHLQASHHIARIDPADVLRVGRSHHHCPHFVSAQRIDGQRQDQGRVDAARQTQNDARKTVFANVVANAQHQGVPQLRVFVIMWAHLTLQPLAIALQCDRKRRFDKAGGTRRNLALCIQSKRAPFKHNFVLPTYQMSVNQGQPRFLYAFAHLCFAFVPFVHMEW